MMSGTRPYSPGFGRHSSSPEGGSVMQRQEPSDGKPKVPDAGNKKYNQSHKRGKTRFRDDKSRKYHGTNSGRSNLKKHIDTSLNRCDQFSLRKESPVKQYQCHLNKKEKAKKNLNRIDSLICATDDSNKDINPLITSSERDITACDGNNHVDNSKIAFDATLISSKDDKKMQLPAKAKVDNCELYCTEDRMKDYQSDAEMKMVTSDDAINETERPDSLDILDEVEASLLDQTIVIEELYSTLREYLQVEAKFQPRLHLPLIPQRGEIGAGTRDGAVHVLRCLKVWYDLPTDVLFHAINLLDRFLTKMKVRLCHISCISVSCMHIAILSHRPQLPPINTEDLVTISQCKCTSGDVRRMSAIIEQKLGAVDEAVSPLHWLRLLLKLLRWAVTDLLGIPMHFFNQLIQEATMVNRLEIILCDASCCNIRACELALVLICSHLDTQLTLNQRSAPSANQHLKSHNIMRIVDFAMELQRLCQISDESFYSSRQAIVCVLDRYNTRQKTPHRQCLVWKLSSRTLKVLRPTDKLTSMLPTIQEQYSSTSSNANRFRSGSECSDLSEDTKDWPTSPVVPILCDNN